MSEPRSSRSDDEAWTPQERAAFDAWTVAPAKHDYADDVVAALGVPRPSDRGVRWPWALAAGLALMWAVQASAWTIPDSGTFDGPGPAELAIGRRAVVVASEHASLTWQVGWTGAASVRQRAGRVFYRVEPGASFEVTTDAGTIRVQGTCFEVEVEHNTMTPTNVTSAIGGAVVAAALTVAVYEGRVDVVRDNDTVSLAAGERVALVAPDEPARVDKMARARSRTKDAAAHSLPSDEAESAAVVPVAAPPLPSEGASPTVTKLIAEKVALSEQVRALTAEVTELREKTRTPPAFEPDAATLRRMAERCELSWDMPTVRVGRSPTISDDDVLQLELTEPEIEIVNRVYDEYNASMVEEVRALYTQITGDDQVGSLSVDSMFAEVRDKVPDMEKQVLFQRLSAERAGLVSSPAENAEMLPLERLYRLFTGAGKRVEQALAAELGADTARRIRSMHNGFSTRNSSSFGCPR